MDESSKKTNQIVEIALCFFIHTLKNPAHWPQIFLHIQAIINNTSSLSIGKIPNKVAYNFTPRRALDLYSALLSSNALVAQAKAADAIFFTLFNWKIAYDRQY